MKESERDKSSGGAVPCKNLRNRPGRVFEPKKSLEVGGFSSGRESMAGDSSEISRNPEDRPIVEELRGK